jgi:nitrate/nitrite transporter NarK
MFASKTMNVTILQFLTPVFSKNTQHVRRTYFQMAAADASALAGAFGLMNLFARSLGGITSDLLFKAATGTG